jgi:Fe2+ transport system protein FeoA
MPLLLGLYQVPYIIDRISGNNDSKKRLHEMGFTQGTEIMIISSWGNNFIVKMRDSSFILSKDLVKRIIVFQQRGDD